MKVLVLNGGSSSLKSEFFDLPETLPTNAPTPMWTGHAEWNTKSATATIRVTGPAGAKLNQQIPAPTPTAVLQPLLETLWKGEAACVPSRQAIDVVGHRIVHGGPNFRAPTLLTTDTREAIARDAEFAPAHNRFELETVEAVDRLLGSNSLQGGDRQPGDRLPGSQVPQVAVFDTGFHVTLEPRAYVYPGPYNWLESGIRRYGFHGINHQYASRRAAELLHRDPQSFKVIVCHLGNGASLAAVKSGKSVDTTMGFTPLEGLMMGSRSGSVDPEILIFLLRRGHTAEQLDRMLNQESGLLGVSGISSDMREIVQALERGDTRAQLAFDIYAHRLTREIGGMLGVLGGTDALVFTGGVGENCAPLREIVCAKLEFLGLKLDPALNSDPKSDQDIAAPNSTVRVLVISAEEEWEIARECHKLMTARVSSQPD